MPESIDRSQLVRLREAGAQVVEVLPAEDFAELHIEGAINLPLKKLAERAGELDRSRPVVVYCNDFQ